MQDLNVQLEIGKTFVSVMVYQGTLNSHVVGGVRILESFHLEMDACGAPLSYFDVLGRLGTHWCEKYGAAHNPQLPF